MVNDNSRPRRRESAAVGRGWALVVYVLFFLSGLTSLIYEVVWGRRFGLVFGVTTYAVATVLSAFFAGLALGSYVAGRLIDRTRIHPLVIYGGMEGVVGVYALLLPLFLRGVEALYPAVYAAVGEDFSLFTLFRFVVCFALLVVPTTLMGATLPVVSKLMVERESALGMNVGRLYAVNTFGAVAGAFSAGFVLIKLFGITHSTLLAAVANFTLAAVALLMSRLAVFEMRPREAEAPAPGAAETDRPSPLSAADKAVLLLAFVAGLTMLALEVVWTRSLVLVLGSTTYAFSAMLTAVLVGIAAGAAVFSRWADRVRNRAALVGVLMFSAGLCAAFGPGIVNWLPYAFLHMGDWIGGNWPLYIGMQFIICFALVLVPTFLSGASFPILVRLYSHGIERVGRTVADVYSINTVGGILGSLLGGFVLIKFFGLERSLVAGALGLMAVGGPVAIALARPWRASLRWGVGLSMIAAVVLLGFLHPRFDVKLLFGGWGPYGGGYSLGNAGGTTMDITDRYMERLLYHKEGVSSAVDVLETGWGDRIISINAKPVATTYLYDMRALKMLGHLPVLMHPNPKDALIIGLGAGVSIGTIASYPSIEHVTVVELCEEVPGGTAKFAKWNFDAVKNPKVKIVINDGANYVKATRKQYDIISSDPIHPFVLGTGILYSTDHWQVCKDRLREGGVIAQWIPLYQLSASDFACIVRSFMKVFPNATMWYSGIDVVLIGVKGDFKLDPDRMAAQMADPKMKADLASMGAHSVGDVLGWFIAGPEELRQMTEGAAVNTVERPVLEYTAPKALRLVGVASTVPALLKAAGDLSGIRGREALEAISTRPLTAQEIMDAATMRTANLWIMRAQLLTSYDYPFKTVDACRNALALRPGDRFLKRALADALLGAGDSRQDDSNFVGSLIAYDEARRLDPGCVSALTAAVFSALQMSSDDMPSLVQGRCSPSGGPPDPSHMEQAWYRLPFVNVSPEEWAQLTPVKYAQKILDTATPAERDIFQVRVYQGLVFLLDHEPEKARKAFEQAGRFGEDQPGRWSQESPTMHVGLGIVAIHEGNREEGWRHLDRALEISTVPIYTLYDIVDYALAYGIAPQVAPYARRMVAASSRAIANDPGLPTYYRYRALAYSGLGDNERAARDRAVADSLSHWWQ